MLRDNSSFRLYFFGSVTSDFGTWLQNSAQVLLAYQLTHSVLTVGFITFAQFTSPLVLGPWTGVLTDKFGGRRTLLTTQVASAVVSATLAALDLGGVLNPWGLGFGAVVGGLAFTFALPARNVPTVDGRDPRGASAYPAPSDHAGAPVRLLGQELARQPVRSVRRAKLELDHRRVPNLWPHSAL
jgi:MFS family permease